MGWLSDEERQLLKSMQGFGSILAKIVAELEDLDADQTKAFKLIDHKLDVLHDELGVINGKLDQLLLDVEPSPLSPAVGFVVSVTILNSQGEATMAKATKAAVDFQVLDSGKVLFTASVVDAAGNPPNPPGLPAGTATPVWTSSDPTILAVASDAATLAALTPPVVDPTGLTAVGTPVALGTGVVVSVSAAPPTGAALTGSANPVDVEAGPAAALVVAEQ